MSKLQQLPIADSYRRKGQSYRASLVRAEEVIGSTTTTSTWAATVVVVTPRAQASATQYAERQRGEDALYAAVRQAVKKAFRLCEELEDALGAETDDGTRSAQ